MKLVSKTEKYIPKGFKFYLDKGTGILYKRRYFICGNNFHTTLKKVKCK